jgi:hypothetical protein
MNKLKLCVTLVAVALVSYGCGSSPTAPAPPPPAPACQTNNTATLILVNNSDFLIPRDAYLDGAFIGTIPYGNSVTREISAGVAHPVLFRSSINGSLISSAQPNLVRCSSFTLTNTF